MSFLVLHELTALLPLPLLVWALQRWPDAVPAALQPPPDMLAAGNRVAARLLSALPAAWLRALQGGEGAAAASGPPASSPADRAAAAAALLPADSRLLLHTGMAYALVKAAMPLRLLASGLLTPAFARWARVSSCRCAWWLLILAS